MIQETRSHLALLTSAKQKAGQTKALADERGERHAEQEGVVLLSQRRASGCPCRPRAPGRGQAGFLPPPAGETESGERAPASAHDCQAAARSLCRVWPEAPSGPPGPDQESAGCVPEPMLRRPRRTRGCWGGARVRAGWGATPPRGTDRPGPAAPGAAARAGPRRRPSCPRAPRCLLRRAPAGGCPSRGDWLLQSAPCPPPRPCVVPAGAVAGGAPPAGGGSGCRGRGRSGSKSLAAHR